MKEKRLITAALPYVNNVPHLGNIIGCVLSADVFARFCRLRKYQTLYICGTDGFGTATEVKAKAENLSPRELCEKYHALHEKIYQHFKISFDAFGKTFSGVHGEAVQDIYRSLEKQCHLLDQHAEQSFCTGCDTFLADRYVEGICPFCDSDQARGDQCDSCGKLLNPSDIKNPRCIICGNRPESRTTRHLYLDLPGLSQDLAEWFKETSGAGAWTSNASSTTNGYFKLGLNPRPITRDLKWGIPVPKAGYENKVFYVWFDAPIGYISITRSFFPNDWQKWWKEPETTKLYQFIGKDNIVFHSIMFPACLIGTGEKWTKVHHLNSTEFLNYENQKFSKSKNIGIFGSDVMEIPFPVDFWRFYLLSVRPEKQDANFLWAEFFDKVNNELIDNIGNLVNRVLVFYDRNFAGPIKPLVFDDAHEEAFIREVMRLAHEVTDNLEQGELKQALKNILLIGKEANRYFHEQEPWKAIKGDPTFAERTIVLLLYVIRSLGVMLTPYIPDASEKMLNLVNAKDQDWDSIFHFDNLATVVPGKPVILFEKIDPDLIPELTARYSGGKKEANKVEIGTAKIVAVQDHQTLNHLFILTLDMGGHTSFAVADLKKHYDKDELKGKVVLVVKNLKPSNFSGVVSETMVLVARKGKKLEILNSSSWGVGQTILKAEGSATELSYEDFLSDQPEIVNHQLRIAGQTLMIAGQAVLSSQFAEAKVR